PGSVPAGEEMYNRHVYLHVLSEEWQTDAEVFGADRAREDWPNVDLSEDGRWLAIEVQQGWTRSEVFVLDRHQPDRGFTPIHVDVEAMAHPLFAGERLLLLTNRDAPNWALFEVDPENPERTSWREIIPEHSDRVLDMVDPVAGRLVAQEMRN